MIPFVEVLATSCGSLVGFVLGLIGGGGSILAVPLLVYVVGVRSPHIAIGTSAIAVALSAMAGLVGHAKKNNVKWRCALVFAFAGIIGAACGSSLGKQFDGQKLLLLFGVLMLVIATLMFFKKEGGGNAEVKLCRENAYRLLPPLVIYGFGVGTLSGFFGIGGGFLIVPGLMAATGMPLIYAIGSSLVSVVAFGATTAFNYALSDMVDWRLASWFIVGGIVGGFAGRSAATALAPNKTHLSHIFAGIVATVGIYVVLRGWAVLES
ncbi:MAG: sulfite exporter TauE/SafE family protein [Proteobacteria bacterium]|nr:sulfite exporter TauE/SafE family protein [Pseudomonadota bacterium]